MNIFRNCCNKFIIYVYLFDFLHTIRKEILYNFKLIGFENDFFRYQMFFFRFYFKFSRNQFWMQSRAQKIFFSTNFTIQNMENFLGTHSLIQILIQILKNHLEIIVMSNSSTRVPEHSLLKVSTRMIFCSTQVHRLHLRAYQKKYFD